MIMTPNKIQIDIFSQILSKQRKWLTYFFTPLLKIKAPYKNVKKYFFSILSKAGEIIDLKLFKNLLFHQFLSNWEKNNLTNFKCWVSA